MNVNYAGVVDISNSKDRDRAFDILKLYAMLSVVLDHSLQHMVGGNIQSTPLYNWIFLSQMPIFMFVSGYFCLWGIYKKTSFVDYTKKIKRILTNLFIPFITFSIILSTISRENLVFKSILNPEYSLWFLWTLMWMQIIMVTAQQISKCFDINEWIKVFISIGCYLVGLIPVAFLYLKWPSLFQSKLCLFYSIFFLCGYFYAFLEKKYVILKKGRFKLASIPILMCIVAFVMLTHPSIMYNAETLKNILYRLIGSSAAILLMLYISTFAIKLIWVKKIAVFGTLSLEMYYIHLLFLKLPFFNSVGISSIVFILKYILLVLISIVIVLTIKKLRWIDMILFGKIPTKKK